MRVVTNAILFGLLVVVGYYVFLRLPVFKEYRSCYSQAYSIYTEGEKGIIIRRFRLGEEQICMENKGVILAARQCIQAADETDGMSQTEKRYIRQAAQYSLSGPKSIEEMITEHNTECPMAKTVINFDPRTNTWF